ncbi:ABC transporter substrate-binding protein [Methylovulum miyakonense]|uniref:ABC transporter substrate-binding protein n=1 Tax=Methylovulum miyakonense TaxID=645578 RepID=UPI00038156D8|nr:ABC transporter substrate-binding protein [Methylovulum miyakonense]
MKYKLIAILLTGVLIGFATCFYWKKLNLGLSGFSVATKQIENDKGIIKITFAQWGKEKYLIYLPIYIAQEKGLFAKHGLDVSLIFSGNDDQVFATVIRGDAQFGVGDPIFTAISRQRGLDGVVVASIVDHVALWGVAKSNAKKYDIPKDFVNTAVGTFPRPSTTYTLMKEMIEKNKVSEAKIVETPIGNELALLEAGQADVVMMLEPAASIAESRGYHVVTSFPKLWGSFAFTGLSTTESWIKDHNSALLAVRQALEEALNLLHDDTDGAVEVAKALFPTLDAKVVDSAVRRMVVDGTVPQHIDILPESWSKAVSVRQSVGDLQIGNNCEVCIFKDSSK